MQEPTFISFFLFITWYKCGFHNALMTSILSNVNFRIVTIYILYWPLSKSLLDSGSCYGIHKPYFNFMFPFHGC